MFNIYIRVSADAAAIGSDYCEKQKGLTCNASGVHRYGGIPTDRAGTAPDKKGHPTDEVGGPAAAMPPAMLKLRFALRRRGRHPNANLGVKEPSLETLLALTLRSHPNR